MSLEIMVKVTPNAKKVQWLLDSNRTLKCYVRSVPEDGKANRELIELISRALKIPKSSIEIMRGATTRLKQIYIDAPISYDEFLQKIGIADYQQNMFKGS